MTRAAVAMVALAMTWLGASAVRAQEPVASPTVSPASSPVETPSPEPAPTEAPSDEPRDLAAELDALRGELDRLREEAEPGASASLSRAPGLRTADLAARAPGAVRFGGVASAGAVVADERDSQFVVPRAAVFAFAPVGDRVSCAAEVTLLGGGAERLDADRGLPGRGEVFLQYAAADLIVVPDLISLRGGLLAVPVGRANLLPHEGVSELLLRPVEALYLVPTPWVDVGAGLLGGVFLGSARLEWQLYAFQGPSASIDARTGLRNARATPGLDVNDDKAVSGRLAFHPVDGFDVAVSGYSGAYSPGGGSRLSMAAIDAGVDAGALRFDGELIGVKTDGGLGTLGLEIPEEMVGGSAQVTWIFLPDTLGAVLPAALQGAQIGTTFRYSFIDTDRSDPDAENELVDPLAYSRRDRLGVGLSFRPVANYVLRAEYEFRTEAASDPIADNRLVLSATASF